MKELIASTSCQREEEKKVEKNGKQVAQYFPSDMGLWFNFTINN